MVIVAPKLKAEVDATFTFKGDAPVAKPITGSTQTFLAYETNEGIDIPVNSVINANEFVGKVASTVKCVTVAQYFNNMRLPGSKTTYSIVK